MGTNYYFKLDKREEIKKAVDKFDYEAAKEIMDTSELHVCKNSGGWLPLFQAQEGYWDSVEEIEMFYNKYKPMIISENNVELSWDDFKKGVINWNGGVKGAIPQTPYIEPADCRFKDPDMPKFLPVSHFDYANGKHSFMYFKDKDGYEFTRSDFS